MKNNLKRILSLILIVLTIVPLVLTTGIVSYAHTMSFDLNGGSLPAGVPTSYEISTGDPYDKVLTNDIMNVTPPSGKRFVGWFYNKYQLDISTGSYGLTYDGTFVAKYVDTGIAKIGSVEYDTLEDAIAAVGDGQMITIQKDIERTESINIEGKKKFVLNLNGHTISTNKASDEFLIIKNSIVTIAGNGVMYARCDSGSTTKLIHAYGSTVNINNGTFYTENTSSSGETNYVIQAERNNKNDKVPSTINIYGGTFYEKVEQGTPKQLLYANHANTLITVYGGTFYFNKNGTVPSSGTWFKTANSGTYSVRGGTFGASVPTLPAGYTSDLSDNYYTVSPTDGFEAKIESATGNTTYCSTFYGAVRMSQSGDTVTMLRDSTKVCTVSEDDLAIVAVGVENLTLDLNGHTFYVDGTDSNKYADIFVLYNSDITVTGDGTVYGDYVGSSKGRPGAVFKLNDSNLTIENGKFYDICDSSGNTSSTSYVVSAEGNVSKPVINIYDGEFYSHRKGNDGYRVLLNSGSKDALAAQYNISGGKFYIINGDSTIPVATSLVSDNGQFVITGGSWGAWNPSAYVPTGIAVTQNGDYYVVGSACTIFTAVTPQGSGSVSPSSASSSSGKTLTFTATPSTGYEFVEWTTTAGTLSDSTANPVTLTVTSDATVTATFRLKKYTVTYDSGNYGTGTQIASGTKTHGQNFTLTSSTYSRSGYIQNGWSTTDGGSKSYDLGGIYTVDADITLYPYWVKDGHTVNVSVTPSNAGTVDPGTALLSRNETRNFTATPESGYHFKSWSVTAGSLSSTTALTTTLTMPDSDITLTAAFEAHTSGYFYTLINSSDAERVSQSDYCVGKTLYKWSYCSVCGELTSSTSSAVTGTASHNSNGSKITETNDFNSATVTDLNQYTVDDTLYRWGYCDICGGNRSITAQVNGTIPCYTITFNANGGSVSVASKRVKKDATYGYKGDLPTATKSGALFTGWFTAKSGGEEVLSTDTIKNKNETLYAHWSTKTYTITYKPGTYGTGSQVADSKFDGVDITLRSKYFTRSGYTQTGWAISDGGVVAYKFSETYSDNADLTLYPVWTETTDATVTKKLSNWTAYMYNGYNISKMATTQTTSASGAYIFAQAGYVGDLNFYIPVNSVDDTSRGINSTGKWVWGCAYQDSFVTIDDWIYMMQTRIPTASESNNIVTLSSYDRDHDLRLNEQFMMVSDYDVPLDSFRFNFDISTASYYKNGSSFAFGIVNSGITTLPGASNALDNISVIAKGADDFVVVLQNNTPVDTRLNVVQIYYGGQLIKAQDISPIRTSNNKDACILIKETSEGYYSMTITAISDQSVAGGSVDQTVTFEADSSLSDLKGKLAVCACANNGSNGYADFAVKSIWVNNYDSDYPNGSYSTNTNAGTGSSVGSSLYKGFSTVTYSNSTTDAPSSVDFKITSEKIVTSVANTLIQNHASLLDPVQTNIEEGGRCYIFAGWYDGENRVTSSTPITGDTALVAKWIKGTSITLNRGAAGYNSGQAFIVTNGTKVKINTPVNPVSVGYKLLGYYADADCTVKVIDDEGNFVSENISYGSITYVSGGVWTYSGANCTLYAGFRYDDEPFNIRYYASNKMSSSYIYNFTDYSFDTQSVYSKAAFAGIPDEGVSGQFAEDNSYFNDYLSRLDRYSFPKVAKDPDGRDYNPDDLSVGYLASNGTRYYKDLSTTGSTTGRFKQTQSFKRNGEDQSYTWSFVAYAYNAYDYWTAKGLGEYVNPCLGCIPASGSSTDLYENYINQCKFMDPDNYETVKYHYSDTENGKTFYAVYMSWDLGIRYCNGNKNNLKYIYTFIPATNDSNTYKLLPSDVANSVGWSQPNKYIKGWFIDQNDNYVYDEDIDIWYDAGKKFDSIPLLNSSCSAIVRFSNYLDSAESDEPITLVADWVEADSFTLNLDGTGYDRSNTTIKYTDSRTNEPKTVKFYESDIDRNYDSRTVYCVPDTDVTVTLAPSSSGSFSYISNDDQNTHTNLSSKSRVLYTKEQMTEASNNIEFEVPSDGGSVAVDSLNGKYVLINGLRYLVNDTTSSELVLSTAVQLDQGTEIIPDTSGNGRIISDGGEANSGEYTYRFTITSDYSLTATYNESGTDDAVLDKNNKLMENGDDINTLYPLTDGYSKIRSGLNTYSSPDYHIYQNNGKVCTVTVKDSDIITSPIRCDYDTNCTVATSAVKKDGSSFVCWQISDEGGTASLVSFSPVYTFKASSDITLIAKYTETTDEVAAVQIASAETVSNRFEVVSQRTARDGVVCLESGFIVHKNAAGAELLDRDDMIAELDKVDENKWRYTSYKVLSTDTNRNGEFKLMLPAGSLSSGESYTLIAYYTYKNRNTIGTKFSSQTVTVTLPTA